DRRAAVAPQLRSELGDAARGHHRRAEVVGQVAGGGVDERERDRDAAGIRRVQVTPSASANDRVKSGATDQRQQLRAPMARGRSRWVVETGGTRFLIFSSRM